MAEPKIYYNPVNGEYTKILESSSATKGKYSLLEVCLKPGGGNPMHYHTRFTEEFIAVQGTLSLGYNNEILHLTPGESRLVPTGAVHRFFNASNEDIIFRIMLRNGQQDFENFIKVLFGLVQDKRTTRGQIPKNIFHAALLLKWGDTHLKNPFFYLLTPFANGIYRLAVKRGIDKKLLQQYS